MKDIKDMDLEELRAERIIVARELEQIPERVKKAGRQVMTDQEKADLDRALTLSKDIDAQIEAIEDSTRRMEIAANYAQSARKLVAPGVPPVKVGADGSPKVEFTRRYRVSALRAFKGATREEADEKAFRSGQWIRATLFNDPGATRWCRENGLQTRYASETIDSAGGALVPNELSDAIIDLREEYGVFRKLAKVYPMGRDTITVPRRSGGLTVVPTSEGGSITESQKTWNQVTLTARGLKILTAYSTELDADAVINIADDLASEMATAFAQFEDQRGFRGTGVAADASIVGVNTAIAALGTAYWCAAEAAATHDTFAEIAAADLAIVMSQVQPRALRNAKWICSSVCKALVFDRLMAAGGGNTIQTLGGPVIQTYLGYPIVVSNEMPVSTASLDTAVMLLFGDLSMAATMGDRKGIEIARSTDYGFANDLIYVRGVERCDINVHDLGGLLATGASTLPPIAGLIGNVA